MKNLKDDAYNRIIKRQSDTLVKTYNDLLKNYTFDLENKDISKALITRLKTYYDTNNQIKRFLNKRYAQPASDFFVEQVLFFIKLFLEKNKANLTAHSERQIKQRRGMMRPDISIWNQKDEVVAIIECKTQLGWNRYNWEVDFLKRENTLHQTYPKAKAFLLVMTTGNWGGFKKKDNNIGKKYFGLLDNTWPPDANKENIDNVILTPFEKLLREINKL
jgi:hypothetical protein